MNQESEKRSRQAESEQQPGDLSSFNKRDVQRSAETEGARKKDKDQVDSDMDNGNSEEKSPVRKDD